MDKKVFGIAQKAQIISLFSHQKTNLKVPHFGLFKAIKNILKDKK